ncbi:hypothetical protein C8F04DRAFT_1182044 [Mycena alexandri]|uniref:Glycan binding protein Y3-like domain-containing protein n=1 Tax=Mycena alexandri TaxID=1745969 RepID=A0AAD6T0K9_9AGAR|nr:hypothetical protein C8F04DRAFT_1182044 [Mycena alexandri]
MLSKVHPLLFRHLLLIGAALRPWQSPRWHSSPPRWLNSSFVMTQALTDAQIARGDSASHCFTGPGTAGLKCGKRTKGDFTAVNTLNVTSHIDLNNCEAALTAAGNQCPLGGSGQFSNGTAAFKYFNDPNTGACLPLCGN